MGWPDGGPPDGIVHGRVALGLAYRGSGYPGWQSQPGGRAVQDHLESALARFAGCPIRTHCAGRTDAGVHALNQVVHFDAPVGREAFSWVRGVNRFLPKDIAVQWCRGVPPAFHARNSARGRRYRYRLLESAARPALFQGAVGWTFRPLALAPMRRAAECLVGEHDFSAFRSSECQAASPVKVLRSLTIDCRPAPSAGTPAVLWLFDFDASAFLHHMVRNLMGSLLAVGTGQRPPEWIAQILAERRRERAAPTFAADGLAFLGPYYDPSLALPEHGPEALLVA